MANKTVFDTNIWISYFLKGKFQELIDFVFENDVEFCRSKELTAELKEVLGRKKFQKYLELPVEKYISFYEKLSVLVAVKKQFSGCRDPKDNYLFDLAIQSVADYLVSGDKDVRETKIETPLQVVTLTKFKELVGQ